VQGRGLSLKALGRLPEAAACFEELLRLNPGDNQGARWELLPLLLELGRDADAQRLSDQYSEDVFANMTYGRALLLFRLEGDSRGSRAALAYAMKANRKVIRYLAGQRKPPRKRYELFSMGSPEEAAIAALDLGPAWRATPGGVEWLIERTTPRPRKRR
jgi:tetratricopeptide (TPR) repeat protein